MLRTRALILLPLFMGSAYSFIWNHVVGEQKRLQFYYNEKLTRTIDIPSATEITSIINDPDNNRLLFADVKNSMLSISSLKLMHMQIEVIVTIKSNGNVVSIAYDPVTELLFWKENFGIYSLPLNATYSEIAVDGNLLVNLNDFCHDIALDSCGGYIYWITDYKMERAQFDGSEREILINSTVEHRLSVATDHQTQKIYWLEVIDKNNRYDPYKSQLSIESADFNGKNRRTLHIIKNEIYASSLAVSKDFIYWKNHHENTIWKLSTNPKLGEEAKQVSKSSSVCAFCHRIAAIKQGILRSQNCKALKSQIPELKDASLLSVNGTKISTESRCKCTQGYTGERCDVLICQNYCLQGDCTVSAEGQLKCSCKAGFSGERCEVNACHKHCLNGGVCSLNEKNDPVCQCSADYEGERCDVSICKDYCLYGNCNVSTDGQPKCSCEVGYSGKRCEVKTCYEHYCLNNGVCVLNEEDEPFCECTADFGGERCEASASMDNCVDAEGQPKLRSKAGNTGDKNVNVCLQYCLNNGTCTQNEEGGPVCKCTADYEGERCDVPAFLNKFALYAYKNMPQGTLIKDENSKNVSTFV